ncbi:MAG TPA: PleD family two-component system response regulator [Allocoleopsis sp.]
MSEQIPLILIADDDKFMRLQLRLALEQDGYRVAEVEDGSQCLAAYTELHPNMILLDAKMPVMDGFTCCTRLQSLPGIEQTPILLVTSLEDKNSVDLAFQSGAADFITKPIHWAVLHHRVKRLLQQYNQARQITELLQQLEQANRELTHLAAIDGLTQIANRRHFDEYLEQEWRSHARHQESLSLILCDLDYFKLYNDTYGHQAGDDCLRHVAKVIKETIRRPADLAARYGGEEFVVILPRTNASGASQIAERMRVAVRQLELAHARSLHQVLTLSLGVASCVPDLSYPPAVLITAADKALYQAKTEGRDRVSTYYSSNTAGT